MSLKLITTPQLLEYHWNEVNEPKTYYSNGTGNTIKFDEYGNAYFEHEVSKNDFYVVEVEYNGQD